MHWKFLVFPFLIAAAVETWDKEIWEQRHQIGGPHGSPFTMVAPSGVLVKKIRVHKNAQDEEYLRGIRVFFSDGSEAATGAEVEEYKEFEFQSGERILTGTLWGDGQGTRTGRIRFSTNMHNDFDYGQNTDGQDEFPMRTGSGLLIGFTGRSGLDIDSLSPVFIRPLKSSHVENVTYPNLDDEGGLELKSLKQADFAATGDKLTFKFQNSEESDFTSSWNFELSTSLGIETTFSAGIPGIESIGLTASWSLDAKTNRGSSETTKSILTFSVEGEVSGDDTKSCTAEFWKGDITTDWNGTMVITTETDKVYDFPAGGRLHRVDASKVNASCRLLSSGTVTPTPSTDRSSSVTTSPREATSLSTTLKTSSTPAVSLSKSDSTTSASSTTSSSSTTVDLSSTIISTGGPGESKISTIKSSGTKTSIPESPASSSTPTTLSSPTNSATTSTSTSSSVLDTPTSVISPSREPTTLTTLTIPLPTSSLVSTTDTASPPTLTSRTALPSTLLSSTFSSTTVLSTATSCASAVAAPTPTQPGVPCQCTQFYKVRQGDTCASVAAGAGLGLDQFNALNPETGVDCQTLFLDYYVCVGAAGYYF